MDGHRGGLRGLATTLAVLAPLLLAACGGGSTANPVRGGADTAGGEAGAGGAEGASLAYVDPRYLYRIDSPGPMTVAADGAARFTEPEKRLEVSIVQGPRASDPLALAQADLAGLTRNATDLRVVAESAAANLSGYRAVKLVYSWTAGTNQVTGKPVQLVTARYYITKDASLLPVVSYGISVSQYDSQGADDLASTFKWL